MLVLPGEKIQAEPVAIEEPEASEDAVEKPQEEQVNGDNS